MKHSQQISSLEAAGIRFMSRGGTNGQSIVLLHGIGGRANSFRSLMECWPEGPRLLAWDCPGYGDSRPVSSARPSPDEYAQALGAALDALEIYAIDLLGQSLGALFAAAFALRFPERVRSLVLMCPALGYHVARDAPLPEAVAQRIRDHQQEGAVAFAAKRASRLVHDAAQKPDVVKAVQDAMGSIELAGYTQAVHALAQGNLHETARQLPQPVLVIAGADDVITPLAGSEQLLVTLRGRPRNGHIREDIRIIGDAGHAVYLEHPSTVALAAASFMAEAA